MTALNCIAIDDDPLFLGQLRAYIEEIEWLTLLDTFQSPIKAATAIISKEPDLLFLDIEMPHLDGYALIDWMLPRLEAMTKKPKIVVISGRQKSIDNQNPNVLVHIPKTTLTTPENLENTLKWAIEASN